MTFEDKLNEAISLNNSLLCIGLDPNPENLKGFKNQFDFNKAIIGKTADLVCCYKPQIAFYAAAGLQGIEDLKKSIDYIHKNLPQVPVILDAKRGDVPSTSQMYVKEVFDVFGADATTVNPYCGFDSLVPFFERKNRGVFVICRTSNASAVDFQDLKVGESQVYVKVAHQIINWSKKYPNVYLEIGATWPGEIGVLRNMTKDMVFLVAGVGAQGGDLEGTLKNGLITHPLSSSSTRGSKLGLIISASRSIIYSSSPRSAAQKLKDEINKYRT